MEVQISLTGKDFVLIALDMNAARLIVKMKNNENKIKELSPALLVSFSREPGMSAGDIDNLNPSSLPPSR
jgi:20S proteasome alpha/beta subunit